MAEIEALLKRFIDDVQRLYGDNLLSAYLYGRALRNNHDPSRHMTHVLLILKTLGVKELREYLTLSERAYRGIEPLFMSPSYIRSSMDAFPIEFLELKEGVLLFGEDFLKDTDIYLRHLRFEVEQEIKGKLLHLRHGFLATFKKGRLMDLLHESFLSYIPTFRASLVVLGKEPPQKVMEILDALKEGFSIDVKPLISVWELRHNPKMLKEELLDIFDRYHSVLETLAERIDSLDR